MTIHLEATSHTPGGPAGEGWNRLSLNAHMGAPASQCALRPRTYAGLWESRNTPLARWGSFGRCIGTGDCGTCPTLVKPSGRTLGAFTDRVLVRIKETRVGDGFGATVRTQPWVMNRPEDGWASRGEPWSWEDLSRLEGWEIGRRYSDEQSEGFWLIKQNARAINGKKEASR